MLKNSTNLFTIPEHGEHKSFYKGLNLRSKFLSAIEPFLADKAIIEDSNNEAATLTAQKKLRSCVDLLSSDGIDQNRVGLQRLLLLTKLRHQVSYAMIFGGKEESIDGRLRTAWLPFLCDWRKDDDDDSVRSFESDDDDVEENPMGKHWGALHNLALRVLVRALEQRISLNESSSEEEFEQIDFSDDAWEKIISSLIHNIETCPRAEIVAQSLKCLRLLHTLEPVIVATFLRLTLLPYILHLRDYGKLHKFPMIESEASRLLKRADGMLI